MSFECLTPCTARYPTRKALSLHQNGCKHVHALEASFLPARRGPPNDSDSDTDQPTKRHRTGGPSQEFLTNSTNPQITPLSPLHSTYAARIGSWRPITRAQARLIQVGLRQDYDVPPVPEVPHAPDTSNSSHLIVPNQRLAQQRPRLQPFRTEADAFGRFRVYATDPHPDSLNGHSGSQAVRAHAPRPVHEIIKPCPNISTYHLMQHHWLGGATKSLESRDALVDMLLRPDFNPRHLAGVNLKALDKAMIEAAKSWNPLCPPSEGWRNIPLRLQIPPQRSQVTSKAQLHDHSVEVPGLRARKLCDVMRKAFSSNNKATFEYVPYELWWRSLGSSAGPAERLSGEIYTSPAMLAAHREVQKLHIRDSRCTLPRCVAAWMFSSDGLQFGSFSHAKGWPIFGYFGNESKYERCKPTSDSCFHIAHVPTLPDKVKEKIASLYGGKPPSEALLTHLRRELMHEVWTALIDDEFVDTWNNGVVIQCADGITRRVFPRIITYSADYPEKVLIATIRNGGQCLCPRCLVCKSSANMVGTPGDMRVRAVKRRRDNATYRKRVSKAREIIYIEGRAIQSKGVEDLLKDESYVPTRNAFSRRLGTQKFDIFSSLVVDQLHEIELGVWKTLFKHLVRLLHLNGPEYVIEFNARFRSVPTYGSSIRLFSEDVAGMGRIAARDFEDILQCCIPVFEGLLPAVCDSAAQDLLFTLAKWHGLAKLRLHTTATLALMKTVTAQLGKRLREFATLTANLDVRETPQEYARRRKRYEQQKASTMTKQLRQPAQRAEDAQTGNTNGDGRRRCVLNLNTYKMHAVGDYVPTIEQFGTTDSYSTQIGELQNRKIKLQYSRTNKRNTTEQMTGVGDICDLLEDMEREIQQRNTPDDAATTVHEGTQLSEELNGGYWIGLTDRSEDAINNIPLWIEEQRHDVAMKFFLPQLKRHLLGRITGGRNQQFTNQELAQVRFHKGRLYRHRTIHINYTSYDILRQHDVLNPSTHSRFVLLPAEFEQHSGAHPYLYAKILGVYHANVDYNKESPRRMDFVHVRWLYYDYESCGGWDTQRMDRLSYEPCQTDQDILDSFDFVDPNDIIRATHLIPHFSSGRTNTFLPSSNSVAQDCVADGDWVAYFVNRFVDRDMLMRYVGGGVGHLRGNVIGRESATSPTGMGEQDTAEQEDRGSMAEDEDAEREGENEEDKEDAEDEGDIALEGNDGGNNEDNEDDEEEEDSENEYDEDEDDEDDEYEYDEDEGSGARTGADASADPENCEPTETEDAYDNW